MGRGQKLAKGVFIKPVTTEAQSCWAALEASVDRAPPQNYPTRGPRGMGHLSTNSVSHRVKAISRGYYFSGTSSLQCGLQNGLKCPEEASRQRNAGAGSWRSG